MKRFKIIHHTEYKFPDPVQLLPHTLRLRPREGHELRIESSTLDISPTATLRWRRDVEGNSVAAATFADSTQLLSIKSEIIIQQYDHSPLDFLVADYAVNYPFTYTDEDQLLLSPYRNRSSAEPGPALSNWVNQQWQPQESIQTFSLLLRLNKRIKESLRYCIREEEGVQNAEQTLASGSGSCRDFAYLFMATARELGFAARFVSGYLYTGANSNQPGSTHAWVEIFIPGAGWKGFDPTTGNVVGAEHIAVAVARRPESIPPVSGSYHGGPDSRMFVYVWVSELS